MTSGPVRGAVSNPRQRECHRSVSAHRYRLNPQISDFFTEAYKEQ